MIKTTTCPECGALAEIERREVLESTDCPIEHATVRCIARHWFFMTVGLMPVQHADLRDTATRSGSPASTRKDPP